MPIRVAHRHLSEEWKVVTSIYGHLQPIYVTRHVVNAFHVVNEIGLIISYQNCWVRVGVIHCLLEEAHVIISNFDVGEGVEFTTAVAIKHSLNFDIAHHHLRRAAIA